jgi:hypothetical protein
MNSKTRRLLDELNAALSNLVEVADEAGPNSWQYWSAWEEVRRIWNAATAPIQRTAEGMGISTEVCWVGDYACVRLGKWPGPPPSPPKFPKFVKSLTRGIIKRTKELRAVNTACKEAILILRGIAEALALRAAMERLGE